MSFDETAIAHLKNYTLKSSLEIIASRDGSETMDIIHITSGRAQICVPTATEFLLVCGDLMIAEDKTGITIVPDSSAAECKLTHLALRKSFVEHYLGPSCHIRCNSALEPDKNYDRLRTFVSGITYLYLRDASQNHLEILSMCLGLLSEIKKNFSALPDTALPSKYTDRIREITRFIENNYGKDLTLSDLAHAFFLTPQYLSRFFSRHFHQSFHAYLMEVRLSHAKRQLQDTTLTMTEISAISGFSHPGAFSRAFKKHYGCTPTAFRQKERNTPKNTPANFEDERVLTEPKTETQSFCVLHGDFPAIQKAPGLACTFTSLINAGHAMNFLDKDFLAQFRQAHELLHFRYVRLEHFISSAVIPTHFESDQHIFGNAHRILDTLKSMNLIPLIELGRTPPTAFMHSAQAMTHTVQPHKHNQRFIRLFEAFLKDCTARYEQTWTNTWLFELWQPDYFYEGSHESGSDYTRRFIYIRDMLKHYMPSARLGGPGFDVGRPVKTLTNTLQALQSFGAVPDFISVYFHGLENQSGQDTLCTDTKTLNHRLEHISEEIRNIFRRPLPLYATKLAFNLTDNTLINDSCFNGAFLIRLMLIAKKYCELTGFWLLSDITGFHTDLANARQTGPGLFRKNGIPKPAFYALAFLNQLGKYELRRGPGYVFTANRPGDYRLLLYRYFDLSYEHRMFYSSMTSLNDVAALFPKMSAPAADYILESIPEGTYSIRRRRLDYANGSILDIDTQGVSHSNLDENDYLLHAMNIADDDLYFLKASCVPETRTIYVHTKESLTLTVRPQNNSIYLFEIILEPDFP